MAGIQISIRSEACKDPNRQGPGCGWAFIWVNGVDRSVHGRGHNIVVLQRNGRLTYKIILYTITIVMKVIGLTMIQRETGNTAYTKIFKGANKEPLWYQFDI